MAGLLDYLDQQMPELKAELDAPVTGYGNEALWEDLDARAVAGVKFAEKIKPAGSTAGLPKR